MNDDHTFRIVVLVGFFAVLLIALPHRLRSRTDEKLDRRQEGTFILATLRPAGLAFWVGLVVFMVNPFWMTWSALPLPTWLRWAGIGVWVPAMWLLSWTLRHLGRNLTDTVVTRREHTLVTDGPYEWIRNPFYDAGALLIVANVLLAANWFLLLTGGLVFFLLVVRTRTEEEQLVVRFGDAYRAYMRRTGRFFPRLRSTRGGG